MLANISDNKQCGPLEPTNQSSPSTLHNPSQKQTSLFLVSGQSEVRGVRRPACTLPFLYMGLFLQLVRCVHSSACMHPKHLPFEGVRTKHESPCRFSTMSSNAVGCLQEFCMKQFLNMPVYLVTNESGSPHAKTFTVTCQVGNHVTTALQPNPGAENMDHDDTNESLGLVGVNTVGRLQEMAQAKKWKMPLYQERGCSTTKKEAKKIAAGKMLAQLNVSRSFGSTSPFGSPITSTTTSASEITNPTIVDVFNFNSIPVSDNLIDLGIATDNEVSLNIKTEKMVNTQVTSQE
uniref:DRBM domain-containing protein n=1 Tax=Timema genevievae TaxID=629358 RepID=A0A7R9PRN8_TIMGE|nr:unnamed protein product [Timema genevievae]